MKKLIFISICLALASYACKKTAAPYYGTIYATVNSVNDTFNANVLAFKDSGTGTYSISVVGFQSAYGNSAELGFQIFSPRPISTGVYTTDSTLGNQLTLVYISGDSTTYDGDTTSATNLPLVTITSITAQNVQGSFSGITFYSDTTSTSSATISNGRFNVYFKQGP